MGLDKKKFLFPISCHPLHQIYLEKDIRSFDGANFWLKMTQNHRKKKQKIKNKKINFWENVCCFWHNKGTVHFIKIF